MASSHANRHGESQHGQRSLTSVKKLSVSVEVGDTFSESAPSSNKRSNSSRNLFRGSSSGSLTRAQESAPSAPRSARRSRELRTSREVVEVLSAQERRLARISRDHDAASAMPTPTAIVYSTAKLVALRERLAAERLNLDEDAHGVGDEHEEAVAALQSTPLSQDAMLELDVEESPPPGSGVIEI